MRALLSALVLCLVSLPAFAQSYSVFEYGARSLDASVDAAAAQIAAAAEAEGWTVVADQSAGVPAGCGEAARVLVLTDTGWQSSLAALNARTAPFMATDRLVVFSDDDGTHVAYVNPPAVVRTALLDNDAATQQAVAHRDRLRSLIAQAVDVPTDGTGYGPRRERGLIGKTMGVMAGGPFDEKIQVHGSASASVSEVADALASAFATPGTEWGMTLSYRLDLEDATVVGVTGRAMEAKSFDIVKAGSNGARKNFACPGLAHAAAYPIEMVVRSTDGQTEVLFIDAMYRMKMFFEDAGKWAFMKNMGMPGSIADELDRGIASALGGL